MPLESPLGTAPELAGPAPALEAITPLAVNALIVVGAVAIGIGLLRGAWRKSMQSVVS